MRTRPMLPNNDIMHLDLSGKTALVTGSTQGIGAAIARGLAAAGAIVAINGRTPESVARAIAALKSTVNAGQFVAAPADLITDEGVAALLDGLPAVDVLVNNLGIFGATMALDISDEEWRRYFEVNVLTAVRLSRAYLPGMMSRSWGRILNIASESAIVTPIEMIQYGMSKTALLAVSRGYAKAAAGTGVTVNSVIAGPTHTEGVEDFVYQLVDPAVPWDEAQRQFMATHRPQSLLKRLIEPDEIANMVVYLSSVQASATTGAAVRVDGGYVDAIIP